MGTNPGAPSCASSYLEANPGGLWSSSDPSVGTVDASSGVFTPLMPGTTTISYSGDSICGTYSYNVTVHALPNPGITGPSTVCVGSTITLVSDSAAGTWSSSSPAIATVGSSSGVVTGITNGTATISYTVTNAYGCAFSATKVVTVLALPDATISGPTSVCVGQTINLTAAGGGTWASSNMPVATVSSSGMVTGVASGTAVISYTVTDGNECTNLDTHTVTVNALPDAISGPSSVVVGFQITLSDATAGGTWSSSNTAIGTVGSATGILRGIAEGTTTVTYALSTGCYVTKVITVNTLTICETVPISICDSILTYCNNFTVEVGNVPAGASVSWNPSIASYYTYTCTGTVCTYSFTSAPPAGMYTVTATLGGFSTNKTVRFVVPNLPDPCGRFSPLCAGTCSNKYPVKTVNPLGHLITAEHISQTQAGIYFLPTGNQDTLAVSPAPGSVIFLDKTKGLVIRPGDSIVLDSVHILSIDTVQPVNTIVVLPSNSPMTKLRIINNSLLEYMDKAVVAKGYWPSSDPAPGQYMIEVTGAIFNRNNYDIVIDSTNATSAYSFKNSIFTNRRLCKYKLPGAANCDLYANWPYVWPTVKDLRNVTAPGLNPIMVLDTFTEAPGNSIGIRLYRAGTTAGEDSATIYTGVVVGDSADANNYNVFDSKNKSTSYGVFVDESNANIYNNIFRNSNFGIHTATKIVGKRKRTWVDKGYFPQTHNRFYNCTTAVNCNPCYTLIGRNAEMSADNARLSNNTTIVKNRGQYGYSLTGYADGSQFNYYEISNNTIRNIERGVATTQLDSGDVFVLNNSVKGIITPTDNSYGLMGIQLSGRITGTTAGILDVENNSVSGYDIGIKVAAGVKSATIQNDTVVLDAPSSSGGWNRTGIFVSGRVRSVYRNHVYGEGTRVNYSNGVSSPNIGIETAGTGTTTDTCVINCNYVHDIPTGFKFGGTNYLQWNKNVMTRNRYGMKIDGSIGFQGTACNPSDNFWPVDTLPSNPTHWPGWTNTGSDRCYQTDAYGVNPATLSRLYVRTGTGYLPNINLAENSGTAYGPLSIDSTTSPCDTAEKCSPYYTVGSVMGLRTASLSGNMQSPGITRMQMEEATFSIFPNPAEDNISIQSSDGSDALVQVTIRTYAAQVLYKGKLKLKNGIANIKLPNAAAGMYMVTVTDEKGQSHQFKLVIQGTSRTTN